MARDVALPGDAGMAMVAAAAGEPVDVGIGGGRNNSLRQAGPVAPQRAVVVASSRSRFLSGAAAGPRRAPTGLEDDSQGMDRTPPAHSHTRPHPKLNHSN